MKKLVAFIVLIGFHFSSFADSPLTSSVFWKTYNHPAIKNFANSKGKINEEGCSFLHNKKEPLETRMAAVNALGWNTKGQQNADAYLGYLISKNLYKNKNEFLQKGQKEDLIIYAYMLAMDNYFDVQASIDICKKPAIANDKSRCIQMISALIKSQAVLYKNYCDVYQFVRKVNDNKQLTNDMKEEAVQEIFNYINIYRKYCSYLYK